MSHEERLTQMQVPESIKKLHLSIARAHEGIPVETTLVEGNTVQEILRKAIEGKFDLIVRGAKGAGKMRGMLIGHKRESSYEGQMPCLSS